MTRAVIRSESDGRKRIPAAGHDGIALDAVGRYAPAFVALAASRPEIEGFLTPPRRLDEVVRAQRARIAPLERAPLWESVRASAHRLGAPAAAIEAIDALGSGAVAVVTGQQPGLLGGPVFSLYKAATAIILAGELATLLGQPVVPIFWVASDDSDFAEIAGAAVAGRDLALVEVALDPALAEPDRMVGHLPVDAGRPATEALAAGGPGGKRASELAGPVWERGNDWGEGFAACLYQLLGSRGLVAVDAREPALRKLARPLIARYLEDPRGFAAAVDEGGEALARAGLGRQLGGFAASHPLWHEAPPRRRRLSAGEGAEDFVRAARAVLAGEEDGHLWPGAALRPLVVDRVLPTVARVLGPAEVTYMAQLAPAYRRLEVGQPPVVPRLTATLVPPAAAEVAGAAGAEFGAILTDPSATLERYYERELPAAVSDALARLENGQRTGFAAAREALAELGRGLDQLVDSVAGKVDFQLHRLREAAAKREKSRREAADPRLRHLSTFLRPQEGLQERRLALLAALALGGEELVAAVFARAESELRAIRTGRSSHHLIGIDP